ncbi:uncharacterized protein LACBIDRAFT_327852 [Laccaria bicolor S238N-H82]|uniref:Predicted protein n=1 Tax=Laccaria bicolor (strain S238N-H82 / ATCC MYA-4686) TaxID=486041 RepID=B0DD06_LACBS|nr:uncharacterized protein LACBIDRAFT_327852 [Laccaria bicolor S238N-H82]EDR07389.1 predicted protein [Laccaria bicolor S238N-H82]|eukprot:XP_001881781.1 predicted protein [Laccaria bicolor S238N-H82]
MNQPSFFLHSTVPVFMLTLPVFGSPFLYIRKLYFLSPQSSLHFVSDSEFLSTSDIALSKNALIGCFTATADPDFPFCFFPTPDSSTISMSPSSSDETAFSIPAFNISKRLASLRTSRGTCLQLPCPSVFARWERQQFSFRQPAIASWRNWRGELASSRGVRSTDPGRQIHRSWPSDPFMTKHKR